MKLDIWPVFVYYGYIAVFLISIVTIGIYTNKKRKERPPVQFSLLRGPGESLRRRVAKFDEDFLLRVAGAALFPFATSLPMWAVILKLHPETWPELYAGLAFTGLAFLVGLIFGGKWTLQEIFRYRDDRLGYLGEREVAEHLSAILAKGYRVFHDVPTEGAKKDFNLDHVAVGPNGVFVIEVKTRRKGRARPGFQDHVVWYDGQQLIWPWGEDREGLDQAKAQADWLHAWIKQRTGLDTPVKPILALPGWSVEMKTAGDVAVVNSKAVVKAAEGKGPALLTPEQVDLIVGQLDAICRDVED